MESTCVRSFCSSSSMRITAWHLFNCQLDDRQKTMKVCEWFKWDVCQVAGNYHQIVVTCFHTQLSFNESCQHSNFSWLIHKCDNGHFIKYLNRMSRKTSKEKSTWKKYAKKMNLVWNEPKMLYKQQEEEVINRGCRQLREQWVAAIYLLFRVN